MDFERTVVFHGDSERAFDLALATLTAAGFRVSSKTSATVDFEGPGMNSTQQSPLVGASRIQLSRGSSELSLVAELGRRTGSPNWAVCGV